MAYSLDSPNSMFGAGSPAGGGPASSPTQPSVGELMGQSPESANQATQDRKARVQAAIMDFQQQAQRIGAMEPGLADIMQAAIQLGMKAMSKFVSSVDEPRGPENAYM